MPFDPRFGWISDAEAENAFGRFGDFGEGNHRIPDFLDGSVDHHGTGHGSELRFLRRGVLKADQKRKAEAKQGHEGGTGGLFQRGADPLPQFGADQGERQRQRKSHEQADRAIEPKEEDRAPKRQDAEAGRCVRAAER